MKVNKAEFFREATTRLLDSTSIVKAWQDCLIYLRSFIPADFFSLHLFNPGLRVVETVVDALKHCDGNTKNFRLFIRYCCLIISIKQLCYAIQENKNEDAQIKFSMYEYS